MKHEQSGIGSGVLPFLRKLKKNNKREWFLENKKEYQAARAGFIDFIQNVTFGTMLFDPSLKEMIDHGELGYKIFRINRDVRFSANKNPYKENFGASIGTNPHQVHNPMYYLHVEPGNSFLAGGIYMPEKPYLNAIRDDIVRDSSRLRKILAEKEFQKAFGGLSQTHTLKTAPRGYPKDHPDIDLLRLKSFIVVQDLNEKDLTKKDFLSQVLESYKTMFPLVKYLSNIDVQNPQ